ncbi:MAG: DUF1259 domain-containing protein [Bryobacteraceae bacterium]|nr:DUF1259 domain-containing protein [Bryobacteraceae bacterium]
MKPFLFLLCLSSAFAAIPEGDRAQIDALTGAKGAYTAGEDVYRVTFPRNDVKVTVEGRAMHPFQGLTSWAAFTPAAAGLMVMGDLVLFEDEVNPVMSAAFANGLDVTALHNHFFYESPRVMFMHIGGTGSAQKLAMAVRRTLDQVREIRAAKAQPGSDFAGTAPAAANDIDGARIDGILGVKGQMNAGMYKAMIGRQAKMHGKAVGNQMGVNTWAAFAGSNEAAIVDGDFAMVANELQPVLRALRRTGINVVAIHNHMTHEEPQYVFLHYWGKGTAASLAQGLRAALDAQQPKQIVFVCEHGAAKSVIAAAYFNQLAGEKGLAYRAIGRGTAPDASYGASTLAGLKADGLPDPVGQPTRIAQGDLAEAARVVTFAVKLPESLKAKSGVTEWNQTPSTANYPAARDAIRTLVEKLISELGHEH